MDYPPLPLSLSYFVTALPDLLTSLSLLLDRLLIPLREEGESAVSREHRTLVGQAK